MTDYAEELLSPKQKAAEEKPATDYASGLLNSTVQHRSQGKGRDYYSTKPFADNPASVGTAAVSGTIEGVDDRIRYFAKQRFPDMPEQDAIQRYGVHSGDIVYVDDEGKVQKEIAGVGATAGEFATHTGIPVLGATVGAMAGGPPGAALGGAGALAWRKLAGQYFGDDQSGGVSSEPRPSTIEGSNTPPVVGTTIGLALGGHTGAQVGAAVETTARNYANRWLQTEGKDVATAMAPNAFDLAAEGVLNYVGAKVGEKFADNVVNRRVSRDAARFDEDLTTHIIDMGRQHGIDVTPAEASGLASLISQQTRLGKGFDDAGDIIGEFYRKRAGQESAAVDEFIGPTPSGAKAGADVREVTGKTIADAKAARTAEAGPLYEQHVNNYTLPGDIAATLQGDPLLMRFARRVQSDPVYGLKDADITGLRLWDTVKKSLHDAEVAAARKGETFKAGRYSEAQRKITGLVDPANPGYAQARAAHAGLSPEVNAYVEGLEGVLAGTKNTGLARSARRLFSSEDVAPGDVSRIRQQFINQGKAAEWDETLNYWLRHQWETIKKGKGDPDGVNVAGDWKKRVYGSERQQKIMAAAMGRERYQALNDLMEVLEATSRVPKGQSMTQPAAEAAKQDAFDAAPVASLAQGFGFKGVREWWISQKTDAWRTSLAKVITNQESLDTLAQLRKLKSLNPRDERVIETVSLALAQAGVYGGDKVLNTPPSRIPQALNQ